MPISRDHVHTIFSQYCTRYPSEREALLPLAEALAPSSDITSRGTFPGHVTCSAVLLNSNDRVLHIHHRALDRLLLPGGHIESDDSELRGTALRELSEETGIPRASVVSHPGFGAVPVDIDIHTIPPNINKGEPEHLHFDFRFVFRVRAEEKVDVIVQREEVSTYSWLEFENVTSPGIAAKLRAADHL